MPNSSPAPKDLVDRLCAELRALEPPAGASNQSAARVWNRLADELGAGCAEFRAEMAALAGGAALAPARQMLLEDHLQNCVACRGALKELRGTVPATAAAVPRRPRPAAARWAWAAVAAAAVIAAAVFFYETAAPAGGEAQVLAASGTLYRLDTPGGLAPLADKRFAYGQWMRAGARADAVLRLTDGSQVEVRGQSEFRLAAARRGTTLDLRQGAVIVQAARQTGGRHLYVATRGALVTVKGTVFSVAAGLRGARVAVLAGQVRVDHDGHQIVLDPGQQYATSAELASAPLGDAFAWSRDSAHYLGLLASLSSLRRDLSKVAYPGLRYGSSLLPLVPADTVFYAALPNLGDTLAQSYQVIQQHLQQDPALRAWWNARHANAAATGEAIGELQSLGADLGDEVVIAGTATPGESTPGLVLAQTNNPDALAARLRQSSQPRIAVVADPAQAVPQKGADFYAWIDNGLLAAAPRLDALRGLQRQWSEASGAGFAVTPFYQRITAAYAQGVSVLVAADVHAIVARAQGAGQGGDWAAKLGLQDLDYFVGMQQVTAAGTSDRASLTFADARQGIAAWLAPPAPMGALTYISPRPQMVVAAEVKRPSAMIADLMRIAGETGASGSSRGNWQGFDPASLAAPLGTEFAFALDGPILPTPAWKAIAEVTDPAAMQRAIGQFLAAWNRQAAADGRPALATAQMQDGGQTYFRVLEPGTPTEVDYTFSGGYLLIAPRAGLLDEALRYRDADYNLSRSPQFLAALPRDSEVNCSAVFYQNLSPALQSLLSLPGAAQITPAQRSSLQQLGSEAPAAACAYADRDSIRFALNGPNSPFGLTLGALLGAPNRIDLGKVIAHALGRN